MKVQACRIPIDLAQGLKHVYTLKLTILAQGRTSMGEQVEHYFSTRAGRPKRLGSLTLSFEGREYKLATSDHVFSYRRIDTGTLLLIDEMRVPREGIVLDLGCGYGVLALSASLRGAWVVGVDINKRAVWLASENLRKHAVTPWLVALGDLYSPFRASFDAIVCNPPIRAGRDTVSRIIQRAPKYLRNGGSLQLVARTKMGARSLFSLMHDTFGNAEEVGKRSGYRVLLSERRGGRVD